MITRIFNEKIITVSDAAHNNLLCITLQFKHSAKNYDSVIQLEH